MYISAYIQTDEPAYPYTKLKQEIEGKVGIRDNTRRYANMLSQTDTHTHLPLPIQPTPRKKEDTLKSSVTIPKETGDITLALQLYILVK